jgi:hypothetical protein
MFMIIRPIAVVWLEFLYPYAKFTYGPFLFCEFDVTFYKIVIKRPGVQIKLFM